MGTVAIRKRVDAKKEARGPEEALALLRTADRVLAVRGKRVVEFDLRRASPTDEELLAAVIGPSGKLRAPTLVAQRTVLVGFHFETYAEWFTSRQG